MNVDGLVAAGLVAFGVSFFAGMETAADPPPRSRAQATVSTQRLDLGLAASLPDGIAAAAAEPAPAKQRSKPAKTKAKPRKKAAPKPRTAAPVVVVAPAPRVVAPAPRVVVPSPPAATPAPVATPKPTSTATPQHFDDGGAPTEGRFDDSGINP